MLRILLLVAVGLAGYVFVLLPWHRRWGATDDETRRVLPGDVLLPTPNQKTTRAITIAAPPAQVWPWLVQIGQGRGGLYSYEWLENLVGCNIHNADRILPEHQTLHVGDIIRMGEPDGYPLFQVIEIAPESYLLLAGADNQTQQVPDFADGLQVRSTWLFYLEPDGANQTRLIVRSLTAYPPAPANTFGWRLVEAIQFVMEQKMLRGIRDRAQGGYA